MKKLLTAIIAVLVLVLCLAGCTETQQQEKFVEIETPFAVLKAPESFEGAVVTKVESEDPYTLSFFTEADNTKLFTLYAGKETKNLLGTLKTNDGSVVLYADFADIDKKNENYDAYAGYQRGIDTIIENLTKDYDFTTGEAGEAEEEVQGTYDIETKVVALKYPLKWQEKVTADVSDTAVAFTAGDVKLFTLYFEEVEGGTLMGTYDGTPIYVVSYDLDEKTLGKEKYDEYAAMQFGVNTISENLEKDSKFVVPGE